MTSGGSRSRSGPPADPKSGRSERRGYTQTALPAEGYAGEVPALERFLPDPGDRHRAIWAELWRTPQACAWALESWRWPVVADLVKYAVRTEREGGPVALATAVRQLRDDLGLSTAGLKVNGWAVKADEVTSRREDTEPPRRQRRLRAVPDGGGEAG